MTHIENYLIELADKLDSLGKLSSANAVDNLIKTASLEKVAQYVGVIGYVLKQERAMQNCIRRKRASSSGAMQEIILSCLKEYQDGQDYTDDQWTSKYAQVIRKNPSLFKEAHLDFLATIGHDWDMETHVNNVRTAAGVLRDEQVDEEKINMILSHINTLGEILSKEAAGIARPFKSAAPSKRSWWSRFWNPGQKDTWSPLGWGDTGKRRRGYGDDLDLDTGIQYLVQQVSTIGNMARSTNRTIDRLKRQNKNLVEETAYYSPENVATARRIRQTIEDLDPADWDKTSKQILELARETQGAKTYNADLFNKVVEFAKHLNKLRANIDDSIDNIYAAMHDIRGHQAMLGARPYGAKNQGEMIAKEYSVLGSVLDKITQNPLDLRGHSLALQQINRLNDVLNVKPGEALAETDDQFGLHKQINDWLGTDKNTITPTPQSVPKNTTETPSVAPNNAAPPTISPSDLETSAPSIAAAIKQNVSDIPSAIEALRQLAVQPGELTKALDPLISRVIHHLGVDHNTQDIEQTNPVAEGVADPNPVPEPSITPEPVSEGKFTMPDDIEIDPEALAKWPKQPRQSDTISLFIKIADSVDPVNKDLANAIDNYIAEHGDLILPKLPEFGVLIREKEE